MSFQFRWVIDEDFRAQLLNDLMFRIDEALNNSSVPISEALGALGLTPAATNMMRKIEKVRAAKAKTPMQIRLEASRLTAQEKQELMSKSFDELAARDLTDQMIEIENEIYELKLTITNFVDNTLIPSIRAVMANQYSVAHQQWLTEERETSTAMLSGGTDA